MAEIARKRFTREDPSPTKLSPKQELVQLARFGATARLAEIEKERTKLRIFLGLEVKE